MKRHYASGSEKRAEKQRRIEAAVAGTPAISSFLKQRSSTSSVDIIPVPAAAVESAEDSEEDVFGRAQASGADVHTSSTDKDVTATAQSGIPIFPSGSSITSDTDLFQVDRSFPSDRGHFPSTITSASLKSMILSHGPCRPTGPFEEDETGRAVFNDKYYHYFSTGNLKITRDWLCFSPSLKRPYCQTCWLFADRNHPNVHWQWINGVSGLSKNYPLKIRRHESSSTHIAAAAVCQRWKTGQRLDEDAERVIRNETNFWRQLLARLINIILTICFVSGIQRAS
jgi:hypothetical protein